jgi:hypothetical protein
MSMTQWIDRIGDFPVEHREIKRPGNKPYYINSHTMIGVLHTTEGDTVNGAWTTLNASHSAPHFIAGEGRIVQCRPLTAQGAALKNTSPWYANAQASIQIEIVGRSRQTLWLPPESSLLPTVAIMRWATGDPLNIPLQRPSDDWLDDCSDCPLPWATPDNQRRRAKNTWPIRKGWYMHMEVPGNDHWDCGAMRLGEMLQMAA